MKKIRNRRSYGKLALFAAPIIALSAMGGMALAKPTHTVLADSAPTTEMTEPINSERRIISTITGIQETLRQSSMLCTTNNTESNNDLATLMSEWNLTADELAEIKSVTVVEDSITLPQKQTNPPISLFADEIFNSDYNDTSTIKGITINFRTAIFETYYHSPDYDPVILVGTYLKTYSSFEKNHTDSIIMLNNSGSHYTRSDNIMFKGNYLTSPLSIRGAATINREGYQSKSYSPLKEKSGGIVYAVDPLLTRTSTSNDSRGLRAFNYLTLTGNSTTIDVSYIHFYEKIQIATNISLFDFGYSISNTTAFDEYGISPITVYRSEVGIIGVC